MGHAQAQITGNAVLRHPHQKSGADIHLARGKVLVHLLQFAPHCMMSCSHAALWQVVSEICLQVKAIRADARASNPQRWALLNAG